MQFGENMEDLVAKLFTWGPFVALGVAAMVVNPANAQTAQSVSSQASVTAVAGAVISNGVGVNDQQLSYSRLSESYVSPQQTVQDCDAAVTNEDCSMIVMEIQ